MTELLWLLLPVAAASGWWAARRTGSAPRKRQRDYRFSNYFKGLNYLLNEQPDKAIEVFIRMVEVDSETIETHLALGSLFRRRGEVDRAIRIHQNLIARPTLDQEQRSHALLELGQDYMHAGLLDRAESLFLEHMELDSRAVRPLQLLCDIYEQEKEWHKAIDIAGRLEARTGERHNDIIAHCYCELAIAARQQGDRDAALNNLAKALNCDPMCVRASILQGELAMEAEDWAGAIKAFKDVEQQDPAYLPEVMEPMLRCHRELEKTDEMRDYLNRVIQRHGGITSVLLLSRLVENEEDINAASRLLVQSLQQEPSMRGLRRLMDMLSTQPGDVSSEHWQSIKEVLDKILEEKPLYICNRCGFNGKSMHWKCPSCKSWNSIKPLQTLEWV